MIYDPVAGKGVGKLLDALSTGGVILIYGVLDMSRLSCHRFRAKEVRLLLGVIAYNLGNLLRRLVLPISIQSWSLKTGGRLIRHARYFILQLAESHLTGESLAADSRAHRAASVAPDLIGRTAWEGVTSGAAQAGVSLRPMGAEDRPSELE